MTKGQFWRQFHRCTNYEVYDAWLFELWLFLHFLIRFLYTVYYGDWGIWLLALIVLHCLTCPEKKILAIYFFSPSLNFRLIMRSSHFLPVSCFAPEYYWLDKCCTKKYRVSKNMQMSSYLHALWVHKWAQFLLSKHVKKALVSRYLISKRQDC